MKFRIMQMPTSTKYQVLERVKDMKKYTTRRRHYIINAYGLPQGGRIVLKLPTGVELKVRSNNRLRFRVDEIYRDLLNGWSKNKSIDRAAQSIKWSLELLEKIEVEVVEIFVAGEGYVLKSENFRENKKQGTYIQNCMKS